MLLGENLGIKVDIHSEKIETDPQELKKIKKNFDRYKGLVFDIDAIGLLSIFLQLAKNSIIVYRYLGNQSRTHEKCLCAERKA